MASFIENLGMGFFVENEENAQVLLQCLAENVQSIANYYGIFYLNKIFGDAQFVLRSRRVGEGRNLEVIGFDTHCTGPCVWNVRVSGVDLKAEEDKLQKRIVASKPNADSGLVPINIVNADVLPSYRKGESIQLQMVAFPVDFDYYADEAAYEESGAAKLGGDRPLLAQGHIYSCGMWEEDASSGESFETSDRMDNCVQIRGVVKKICVGEVTIGEYSFDAHICCFIDTEYGELEIIHSMDQVKESQQQHLREGAVISGTFVLSGDAAINEYEKGIVLDEKNDFRLLRGIFAGGDPDRLCRVLSDDAVLTAEYDNRTHTFAGAKEIIRQLKFMQKDSDALFTYFATISSVDEGEWEPACDVGARCIVIARGEKDNYGTIVFVEVNDKGKISGIRTTDNRRYHFHVNEE